MIWGLTWVFGCESCKTMFGSFRLRLHSGLFEIAQGRAVWRFRSGLLEAQAEALGYLMQLQLQI
jgi:hypothetical protein